ncbi:MAG: hypothetical protein J0H74_23750 [Chitinophagaceae bacterium]|nr:hypothetical protein [Chitinophagaceae bacterium]
MTDTTYDKRENYIDWITIFLLIGNSANPFFYRSVETITCSFIFLFVLSFFKKERQVRLNKYFYIYMGLLVTLQGVQAMESHLFPLKTFFGEYLRIGFAVLAITMLGQRFFEMFVRFVYVFAIISLCFYIPSLLIKGFAPFMIKNVASHTLAPFVNNYEGLYVNRENIIIFNFGQIDLHRNSGFYWEPGTHGGFLLLAMFLNLFCRKEALGSRYNKIFLLTILTTLSTTTYIAVFFVILVYLKEFFLRRPALSIFILLALAASSFLLYNNLEFLNKKINKQIEYSNKGLPGESRFNSLLVDIKSLSEHPLIGTGRNIEMKFGKNFYNVGAREMHRNNGLGVLLSTYGVIFFCLWLVLLYKTFYIAVSDKVNALMGVLLILIIGFSEDYFFKIFFIALVLYCGVTFVPVNVRKKSRKMQLGIGVSQ